MNRSFPEILLFVFLCFFGVKNAFAADSIIREQALKNLFLFRVLTGDVES